MNIRRFNEGQSPEEFLEEVETVFSYMHDNYSILTRVSAIDKNISMIIDKEGNFPDIFLYIAMLNELEDCLKKLAIKSTLYYCYYDYQEDMLITLSRTPFNNSKEVKS
jgi:hypothetical protein